MIDLSVLERSADEALRAGRYSDAFVALDAIIEHGGDAPEVVGALFLKATGFEKGYSPEGVNEHAALCCYENLLALPYSAESLKLEGHVGAARMMASLGAEQYFERILKHCSLADAIRPTAAAANILGYVYHEGRRDIASGRKWFLKAFFRGSPWGLRFLAASHWRGGNLVRGGGGHILATWLLQLAKLVNRDVAPYRLY